MDVLSDAFGEGEWKDGQKFLSLTQEARIVTFPVLLLKPQTYMNRSGEALRKCVDFYKLNPAEQLIVLCDDIDIPLGELRLRRSGGPGTHNGLKSVHEQFGEDFVRIRIGVGPNPPGADLSQWVLSVPPEEERTVLAETLRKLPDSPLSYRYKGQALKQA